MRLRRRVRCGTRLSRSFALLFRDGARRISHARRMRPAALCARLLPSLAQLLNGLSSSSLAEEAVPSAESKSDPEAAALSRGAVVALLLDEALAEPAFFAPPEPLAARLVRLAGAAFFVPVAVVPAPVSPSDATSVFSPAPEAAPRAPKRPLR